VKPRIDVRSFELAPDANITRCTDKDRTLAGPVVAIGTAIRLRKRGVDGARADQREDDQAPEFVVSGSVYRIDGGSEDRRRSRSWMLPICTPCYFLVPDTSATVGVTGEVTRNDGTLLGRFHFEHSGDADSEGAGIDRAAQRVGEAIAKVVDEGSYDGEPVRRVVATPAAAPPETPPPPAAKEPLNRLEQLEVLRKRGLISEDEYRHKRAEILHDL
jgi:hypothetical protein